MEIVQELSRQRNEIERLRSRDEAIETTLRRLDAEDEESASQAERIATRLSEESRGQAQLSETVIAAEREFHQMEERKQALRNDIDRLQNKAFELQGSIGEKMTRIDFLNGLVDRLEGYNESVQHLLRNRDWAASRYGTIADAVNTREEFRVAVEAALGEAAHYILVNDVPEAISGLSNLKEYRKGKGHLRLPEPHSRKQGRHVSHRRRWHTRLGRRSRAFRCAVSRPVHHAAAPCAHRSRCRNRASLHS
jgi:chromosome segregation protein